MEFDQSQPLGRQIDRELTVLEADPLRRREICRAAKRLNLSLRWISRFGHGCVGADEGSVRRIETVNQGAMIFHGAFCSDENPFVFTRRAWQE